ncbi:hypothetical protein DPMN_164296 [Dreissena polymorpha]|uniref:Uncharacterized protein n=1 Tax=Dreissena polymorpha TaxID=45954 RepID=A0A9D4ITL3_DREPO|nr:hypothetical protein DPMN_164288 [Dreissena polymorpha]KAH3786193.1 hypothetical protein DPMN_164296 [Dreissena polymorpha]
MHFTVAALAIANPPPSRNTTPHGTFSAATFQEIRGFKGSLVPADKHMPFKKNISSV